MWYAVIDGEIWLETKAKSQKAVNLRRVRWWPAFRYGSS